MCLRILRLWEKLEVFNKSGGPDKRFKDNRQLPIMSFLINISIHQKMDTCADKNF